MLLLALMLACGGDKGAAESADPCAEVPYDLNWANFGDGFFANYCRACHSSGAPDRFGAPDGINFDTLEEVRAQSSLIAFVVIEEQSMPEGGGVYEQDLEFLGYFLECGLE